VAYQYEVKSVRAFVQRIACEVANRGYLFYVTGHIPADRVPEDTDRKLLESYGLSLSKFQRYRRRSRGIASVQYVRHGHFFAMLATAGENGWFEREQWPREIRLKRGSRIKDLREESLRYAGYQIALRRSSNTGRNHVSVRIQSEEFFGLKAYFVGIACRRSVENLRWEYAHLPFEPYRGVKKQYGEIARAVNAKRKTQGLESVPLSALPARRKVVPTFLDVDRFAQVQAQCQSECATEEEVYAKENEGSERVCAAVAGSALAAQAP
jgi:hypothetical protein